MTILDRFRLTGKTALVTGARRGIGKAVAVALAEAGADIVATSAALETSGSEVQREAKLSAAASGRFRATWPTGKPSTRWSKP